MATSMSPIERAEVVDKCLMRADVCSVEVDYSNIDAVTFKRCGVDSVGRAARKHHGGGGWAEQLARDGAADLAGSAENQDGLRLFECVFHEFSVSCRRRLWSLAHRRFGSTRR